MFNSFMWISKGLSHRYACIHSPQSPLPFRLPHNIENSSLYYTVRQRRIVKASPHKELNS